MSYSAFFTAGLTLASHPREYESLSSSSSSFTRPLPPPPLPLPINAPPRRMRKRRSSLTIATSPISTIKLSSGRTATDTVKSVLHSPSPRDATFFEALQAVARPKMMRRMTINNTKDLPSRPAPTAPLPTLPHHHHRIDITIHSSSVPKTPTEETYPSSPINTDSPYPTAHYTGALRAIPSRRSSFLLPLENAYGGNIPVHDIRKDLFKDVPGAEWYDEEEDKKENDADL